MKRKSKAVNSLILILSTLSLKKALTFLLLTNLKDGQLQPLSSPAALCTECNPIWGPTRQAGLAPKWNIPRQARELAQGQNLATPPFLA